MLDISSLLQPVTSDAPSGPNLEYSPEFAALERTASGKPERQVGETIVAAEEPDWASVAEEKSAALLRSSKDLRIAAHLARALLETQGYAGLADGLVLVQKLVADYWPVLHPQLDEEDNDPTSRVNAMAALTHRDMVQAIRRAPLLKSKAFGVVTLNDFDAGNGRGAQGDEGSSGAASEAALEGTPIADLAEAARAVGQCDEAARGVEALWGSHVDSGGPDFTELRKLLAQANKVMKTRLERRQGADDPGAPDEAGGSGVAAVRGQLRSREDVVRALDGICAYYARNEPSSPVPLLLERCKRLVAMSFLDIVKDMVPDGLSTIQTIAGKPKD